MRSLVLTAALLVSHLHGASNGKAGSTPLTVILDFEQKEIGTEAIQAMQWEAASILRYSGISLDWTSAQESIGRQDLTDLVVFKMRGTCVMDSFPVVADELGMPLAITHTSNGDVLSFGAVDCDRVRNVLKRTLAGGDYARGDLLYGRALGRVMAHELYHMLARTGHHSTEGVARECLSARELVRDQLMLSDKSLRAIRQQMELLKKKDGTTRTSSDRSIPAATALP